jgi:hypothetical protein
MLYFFLNPNDHLHASSESSPSGRGANRLGLVAGVYNHLLDFGSERRVFWSAGTA